MNKTMLGNYPFNATAKTLDLSAIPGFDFRQLRYVHNLSTHQDMYVLGDTVLTAVVEAGVLGFALATGGMQDDDLLEIIYDDQTDTAATTLGQINTAVGNVQAAINAVTSAVNAVAADINTGSSAIAGNTSSLTAALASLQALVSSGNTALGTLHGDGLGLEALLGTGNAALAAIQGLTAAGATAAAQAAAQTSLNALQTALGTANGTLTAITSAIAALGSTLGGGATLQQIVSALNPLATSTDIAGLGSLLAGVENSELAQLTGINSKLAGTLTTQVQATSLQQVSATPASSFPVVLSVPVTQGMAQAEFDTFGTFTGVTVSFGYIDNLGRPRALQCTQTNTTSFSLSSSITTASAYTVGIPPSAVTLTATIAAVASGSVTVGCTQSPTVYTPNAVNAFAKIADGTTAANVMSVKAASTLPAGTDLAAVVTLRDTAATAQVNSIIGSESSQAFTAAGQTFTVNAPADSSRILGVRVIFAGTAGMTFAATATMPSGAVVTLGLVNTANYGVATTISTITAVFEAAVPAGFSSVTLTSSGTPQTVTAYMAFVSYAPAYSPSSVTITPAGSSAPADGSSPSASSAPVNAYLSMYNGSTQDRVRSNIAVSVLASGTINTVGTSFTSDITVHNGRGIKFLINVSGITGTPSLLVKFTNKDSAISGNYFDAAGASMTLTATGQYVLTVYSGVTPAATSTSVAVSDCAARACRLSLAFSGASSSISLSIAGMILP
jgi:hypothetical protein